MNKRVHQCDVMVCTDCYFAHHYGAHQHDEQWFAGESDEPCDREPLSLLDGYDIVDNTNSETGEGIEDFSWRSCEGCGSKLGGARYRLALFATVCVKCGKVISRGPDSELWYANEGNGNHVSACTRRPHVTHRPA